MNGLKEGTLVHRGRRPISHVMMDWWKCVTCKSEFPEINGVIKCNGYIITQCPWCRKDSEPWKNGRGH